jgi:protein-S-isoprenylcysteine O-methyltransferase Ste14
MNHTLVQPLPFTGPTLDKAIFWSAYVLWIVAENVAAWRKRSGEKSKELDRGSYKLILGLLWLAIGFDFASSYIVPRAAILWHRSAIFFAGVTLLLLGLAFRFYAMSVLGKYFTYDVRAKSDQKVIQRGPYRFIRHPSYTGALITLLGIGLALGNWAGLLVMIAAMGIAYSYRMLVEEAALANTLGEPYRNYMQRTKRLIPFVF